MSHGGPLSGTSPSTRIAYDGSIGETTIVTFVTLREAWTYGFEYSHTTPEGMVVILKTSVGELHAPVPVARDGKAFSLRTGR